MQKISIEVSVKDQITQTDIRELLISNGYDVISVGLPRPLITESVSLYQRIRRRFLNRMLFGNH